MSGRVRLCILVFDVVIARGKYNFDLLKRQEIRGPLPEALYTIFGENAVR